MGFGIKKEAGSNTTPSQIVNFDKLTPTTAGVVFDPNTPQTLDVLYVSSVDASTWIWNGTAYITYTNTTASTEWYLLGTTIDAGSNKTASISRNASIYTQGSDSYFNGVRVGRGTGSISTNTVVGNNSGANITTGFSNTFLGLNSGANNTSGYNNTFLGTGSGNSSTTGNTNTFIGSYSGYLNTSGESNTFIGYNSGNANTTGTLNTFVGWRAGQSNTTASNNTFIGTSSGFSNTNGISNTFFGSISGRFNTTGINLSGIGEASLYNNTTGSNNVGLGLHTLFSNVTGSNNTSAGNFAGRYLNNGTSANTTPENSVFLGYGTRSLTDNDTNQIVIGYLALGKGSNTVNIGNTSITDSYINGTVHISNTWVLPTTAPTSGQVLGYLGSGTTAWVTPSTSGGVCGIANSSGVYTYYATLSLAMTAAVSGNTIELFSNITETGSVAITLKSGVKINGNGNTYTLSVNDNTNALICNSGTVELFNWKVVRTGRSNGAGGYVLNCLNGTLKCQGVLMENTYGNCVIDGVSIYNLQAKAYLTGFQVVNENTKHYNCIGESTGTGDGILSTYSVNCTGVAISGAGITGNGTHLNGTGISTSGYGLSGQTFTGCIGISTSGTGVFASAEGRNCIGMSTSGVGGYGIFYNSTLISSSNYGVGGLGASRIYNSYVQSTSSVATLSTNIYSSTVRCLWNNAGGNCMLTNALGSLDILNSFLEVTNASAYCITGYAGSTWKYSNNSYKGATNAVNTTNITQGIINTQDNQGNILI